MIPVRGALADIRPIAATGNGQGTRGGENGSGGKEEGNRGGYPSRTMDTTGGDCQRPFPGRRSLTFFGHDGITVRRGSEESPAGRHPGRVRGCDGPTGRRASAGDALFVSATAASITPVFLRDLIKDYQGRPCRSAGGGRIGTGCSVRPGRHDSNAQNVTRDRLCVE